MIGLLTTFLVLLLILANLAPIVVIVLVLKWLNKKD